MLTSKITSRSQTTLPAGVRDALQVGPGERLGYIIAQNRVVLVNASTETHEDPVLAKFLAFLGRDLAQHPERVRGIPPALVQRARDLTKRVRIDHDEPIDGAVAI